MSFHSNCEFRIEIMALMRETFHVLETPIQKLDDRAEKAGKVKACASMLLKKWQDTWGRERVKYYLHMLAAHIPESIQICPVDIWNASALGIESDNFSLKRTVV